MQWHGACESDLSYFAPHLQEHGTNESSDPAYRSIATLFHLTQKAAAAQSSMGLTTFKKFCRANGVQRWPNRKVRTPSQIV